MALELGDVIARIGGDGGGGGPVPYRYVYDFGHAPIPVTLDGDFLTHEVPDVPSGATLVATLEWHGPETLEPAVAMGHVFDPAWGLADTAIGVASLPLTVVTTAYGRTPGMFGVGALAEGCTATKLTVIIIPYGLV